MASHSVAATLGNPEILSLILNKLQHVHDILVAARVSKLWRSTAHKTCSTLWLSVNANSNCFSVLQCIRHFSSLTSLKIRDFPRSEGIPLLLGGLAVAFPNLRELIFDVGSQSPPIGPYHLKGFLEAYPSLQSFTYSPRAGLAHPEALSGLSRIKHLDLQLEVNLPESFHDLTTLRKLRITDMSSQLCISPSITKLVNLTSLTASIDDFSSLPPSFGVVPCLKDLTLCLQYLRGPQARTPLPDLRDLPRLRRLFLHTLNWWNPDDVCVPGFPLLGKSLRLPASLVQLNLDSSPVSTLPDGWEDLSSLQALNLQCLPTLQEIPASIGKLKSLRVLDIDRCPLVRWLPEGVGELEELQYLYASDNESLESIPRGLTSLRNLKWLKADNCLKLGRLPWQLRKLIKSCAGKFMFYELLDSGLVFTEEPED